MYFSLTCKVLFWFFHSCIETYFRSSSKFLSINKMTFKHVFKAALVARLVMLGILFSNYVGFVLTKVVTKPITLGISLETSVIFVFWSVFLTNSLELGIFLLKPSMIFFPRTAGLWNSRPIECSPLTYYINYIHV